MDLGLKGKKAVVTGASKGIGKAIALALVKEGAWVAAVSSSGKEDPEAEALAVERTDSIERGLSSYVAYKCNVADSAEVEATARKIITDFGGVDILVNNAGITKDGILMRMTDDDWNAVLATNLTGAMYWTRALVPTLRKLSHGRIVNIGSPVGTYGNAGQTSYAASKGGLIGFSKSVAAEYGAKGMTCNVLAPGYTETRMTNGLSDQIKKDYIARINLRRPAQPAEIAAAVVFLCSAQASYITASVIPVDGGITM
jgi:3-oxoacyl-[acyl-carrier protein] reductase